MTPTGPPPESDEGALRVETLAVGPFQTNCHLVHDPASGEGFVVDPGAEAERILGRVAALALRPAYVLLTHGHGDHIAALETVAGALRCPVYIHPADEPMLESPTENLSAFAGTPVVAPVPHRTYADGDELPFAGRTIRVLHTPGHSAGGVSLFVAPDLLFSGDALFRRSIGRTDFPGGSYEALRASIEAKILTLDDQVRVFPGHDRPTTVGEERRENPFLRPG